jgi:hypothetical protein
VRRADRGQLPDLYTYHARRLAGELPSGALGLPRLRFRSPEAAAGPRVEVDRAADPPGWRPRWTAVPTKPRRPL